MFSIRRPPERRAPHPQSHGQSIKQFFIRALRVADVLRYPETNRLRCRQVPAAKREYFFVVTDFIECVFLGAHCSFFGIFIGINRPSPPPSNRTPKADSLTFALLQISTFGSSLIRPSKRCPAN